MIVCHKHKFIFVHVPKTGGSSVLAALAPLVNSDKKKQKKYPGPGEEGWRGWQVPFHCPKMHNRLSDADYGILDQGYFIFGLVRNPWAWVWSYYHIHGKGRSLKEYIVQDYSRVTYHGCISWPQTSWFTDSKGKLRADFIGKLENIEEDFAQILKSIGAEGEELSHQNIRNYDKDYRKYYDDESKELIAHAHKKDIETFGYTF